MPRRLGLRTSGCSCRMRRAGSLIACGCGTWRAKRRSDWCACCFELTRLSCGGHAVPLKECRAACAEASWLGVSGFSGLSISLSPCLWGMTVRGTTLNCGDWSVAGGQGVLQRSEGRAGCVRYVGPPELRGRSEAPRTTAYAGPFFKKTTRALSRSPPAARVLNIYCDVRHRSGR